MKVLVTGGAGFIGSHIVDALLNEGKEVRILDNLVEQVHHGKKPEYLSRNVEFIQGDVTKKEDWMVALEGVDVVYHEAAAVGVGQSMYEINEYMQTNTIGTSMLLNYLVNEEHSVKKMIVAASMSSYGEGLYQCDQCGPIQPPLRGEEQLKKADWEPCCPGCQYTLKAIPTPETTRQNCNSIYALSKKNQEDLVIMIGKTYGIPAVALRYFNVYGSRQSLSNPYTGVAAIFMSRVKNKNAPTIYEDGLQTRDFIAVEDVAEANIQAMNKKAANYEVFNIGSGTPITIRSVAELIGEAYDGEVQPDITNKYRKGDVRHCYADIQKAKKKLEWEPKINFEQGMKAYIDWSRTANAVDGFEKAEKELKQKGLA